MRVIYIKTNYNELRSTTLIQQKTKTNLSYIYKQKKKVLPTLEKM